MNKLNVLMLCFIHNEEYDLKLYVKGELILSQCSSKYCKTCLVRSRLMRYSIRTCFAIV